MGELFQHLHLIVFYVFNLQTRTISWFLYLVECCYSLRCRLGRHSWQPATVTPPVFSKIPTDVIHTADLFSGSQFVRKTIENFRHGKSPESAARIVDDTSQPLNELLRMEHAKSIVLQPEKLSAQHELLKLSKIRKLKPIREESTDLLIV